MTTDDLATIRSDMQVSTARAEERHNALLREFDQIKSSNNRTHERIDEVARTARDLKEQVTSLDARVQISEDWLATNGQVVERIDKLLDQFSWKRLIAVLTGFGLFLTVLNGVIDFVGRVH